MLHAFRSDNEDRRLPGSRSPFLYLAAALTEAPVRPCPTPDVSLLLDSISRSGSQLSDYAPVVGEKALVFPDEGHGFERPENRLKFYAAAEAFLAQYLGGRAEPPSEAERVDNLRK